MSYLSYWGYRFCISGNFFGYSGGTWSFSTPEKARELTSILATQSDMGEF